MRLFDLRGTVARATGATRGIGRAIAEEMARHGAAVAISSNEGEECAARAAALREEGCDAIGVACDVTSREQLEALVARTLDAFGKIDVLVCNAGVAPHVGPIASASAQDWDITMTVNLRSVLWLTSLVIPEMAQRRDGAVISTSRIAGLRGNKSIGL